MDSYLPQIAYPVCIFFLVTSYDNTNLYQKTKLNTCMLAIYINIQVDSMSNLRILFHLILILRSKSQARGVFKHGSIQINVLTQSWLKTPHNRYTSHRRCEMHVYYERTNASAWINTHLNNGDACITVPLKWLFHQITQNFLLFET